MSFGPSFKFSHKNPCNSILRSRMGLCPDQVMVDDLGEEKPC